MDPIVTLSFEEWRDAPEILRAGCNGPPEGRAWYRIPHNDGFRWLEDLAGLPPTSMGRCALTSEEAEAAQAVASYWQAQEQIDDEDGDEIDMSMLDWRPSAEAQVRLAEKKALKRRQDHAAGKAYLSTLRSTLDVHAANRAARDARQSTK